MTTFHRVSRMFLRAGCAALLIAAFALGAAAQSNKGTITGTVTDPNGAVVKDAKVTVTNVADGQSRDVTTSDDGTYSIPALDPGVYRLTVEAAGFSQSIIEEVKLDTAARQAIDVTLDGRRGERRHRHGDGRGAARRHGDERARRPHYGQAGHRPPHHAAQLHAARRALARRHAPEPRAARRRRQFRLRRRRAEQHRVDALPRVGRVGDGRQRRARHEQQLLARRRGQQRVAVRPDRHLPEPRRHRRVQDRDERALGRVGARGRRHRRDDLQVGRQPGSRYGLRDLSGALPERRGLAV